MQKKGLVSMFLFVGVLLFFTTALAAPQKGEVPDSIEAAFYDSDYKCIYMKSASIKSDTWQVYRMAITKANIGYDGKSGNYTGFSMVRIKASTKSAGKKLAVYLDNVVLRDASGKKVVNFTFEKGETYGPYFSWGKKLKGAGKVVKVKGKNAFTLYGTTTTQYGSTGLEVQWTIKNSAGSTFDFSKAGYTISFDYYVSTK